ncbi:MAG: hypothetical protein ACI8PZ_002466 [Myxococcota bacterium]|jgi:hypothetical protein
MLAMIPFLATLLLPTPAHAGRPGGPGFGGAVHTFDGSRLTEAPGSWSARRALGITARARQPACR